MTNTYTFDLHDKVTRTSVRFKNRYGIELAGTFTNLKIPLGN